MNLNDVMEVISFKRGGKAVKNVGLEDLTTKLIEQSFARRKLQFLRIPELRTKVLAAGYKQADIEQHWNDPETLDFLIMSKTPELWTAAAGLSKLGARETKGGRRRSKK
jgi:hypothetical protein